MKQFLVDCLPDLSAYIIYRRVFDLHFSVTAGGFL